IEPAEADTIRAIFEWYAQGASITSIITRLVEKARPAPRVGSWRVGAVKRILRNPKYTGRLVWGRTQQTRRPGSRTKAIRQMPPEQWQTHTLPDLRIVSDDLWGRVQAR